MSFLPLPLSLPSFPVRLGRVVSAPAVFQSSSRFDLTSHSFVPVLDSEAVLEIPVVSRVLDVSFLRSLSSISAASFSLPQHSEIFSFVTDFANNKSDFAEISSNLTYLKTISEASEILANVLCDFLEANWCFVQSEYLLSGDKPSFLSFLDTSFFRAFDEFLMKHFESIGVSSFIVVEHLSNIISFLEVDSDSDFPSALPAFDRASTFRSAQLFFSQGWKLICDNFELKNESFFNKTASQEGCYPGRVSYMLSCARSSSTLSDYIDSKIDPIIRDVDPVEDRNFRLRICGWMCEYHRNVGSFEALHSVIVSSFTAEPLFCRRQYKALDSSAMDYYSLEEILEVLPEFCAVMGFD